MKNDYFSGHEELAEGFADDNPLAGSASYQVFLHDITTQDQVVAYLQQLGGVREVNYSNSAAAGLSSFNAVIGILSLVIIGVLLAVSVFLISNTVTIGIAVRKEEIAIMKLIGATNSFVKAPFVVEGILIGVIGGAIPLTILYFLYTKLIGYMSGQFERSLSVPAGGYDVPDIASGRSCAGRGNWLLRQLFDHPKASESLRNGE